MVTTRKKDHEVEKGLSGAGKLKILRLLMKNPDHAFTRYEIGKKVPSDPVSIRNNLQTLIQINWVTNFQVQHLNKYSINLENDVVKRLVDFLREIRYI
jgi:response regulator of citrate/malate metabolism